MLLYNSILKFHELNVCKGLCICIPAKPIPSSSHSVQGEESIGHQRQSIQFDVDAVEAIHLLEQQGSVHENHNVNPLEALLGGGVGFAPILDIPPDADDETMVELAIALSLQVKI